MSTKYKFVLLVVLFDCISISAYENCRVPITIKIKLQKYIRKIENTFGQILNKELKKLKICRSRSRFYEIRGGYKMKSFYDRTTKKIYLRHFNMARIKHEFLHFYLDYRFYFMPYSLSETLVELILMNYGKSQSVFPVTQRLSLKQQLLLNSIIEQVITLNKPLSKEKIKLFSLELSYLLGLNSDKFKKIITH